MKKYIPVLLSIFIIVFLGFQQRWYDILSGDLWGTYYPLAQYFWLHGNLKDFVSVSAYPPGANLFFMALPPLSSKFYEWSLIIINCLFLLLIGKLTNRAFTLALIVIATGPIILFRFDLFVMLLVVLSIITFRHNNFRFSGMFLGLATITKLFPIILAPYFLFILFGNNRRKIFPWFLSFIFSIIFIIILYVLLTGQNWSKIIFQTNGVHVESVVATALTIITGVTNPGPHGLEFVDARWNILPLYFLGHDRLFKLISPFFVALIYIFIIFQKKIFKISNCLLIILTLLITSQLLSPQYVIWPAMLILLEEKINKINIILLLLALVLTQIIYPLNYGEFLDFYNKGINLHLFLIMTSRNISLVILTLRLLYLNNESRIS